jgi:hypothetical protein
MIKPEIKDNILHLYVEGADKIWALKSQLSIPLEHITGIRLDEEVVNKWWHGLKMPGTNIPHVITAGTFYQDGKRVFWDIHHPKQAVVISLADEKYNELAIEVENPEMFVQEIQEAIKPKRN